MGEKEKSVILDEHGLIAMSPGQLREMVRESAEAALDGVGISTEDDVKNLRAAVEFGGSIREFRTGFIGALGRKLANGFFWLIVIAIVIVSNMNHSWLSGLFGKGG